MSVIAPGTPRTTNRNQPAVTPDVTTDPTKPAPTPAATPATTPATTTAEATPERASASTVASTRSRAVGAEAAARARATPPAPSTIPLKDGATGAPVEQLQRALTHLGHLKGAKAVDGDFGPRTDGALRDFQRQHGLTADGIYGPKTRAAMQKALSPTATAATTTPVATDKPAPTNAKPGAGAEPTLGSVNPKGRLGEIYRSNTERARNAEPTSKYASQVNKAVETMGKKEAVIDEIARKANLPPSLVGALWHREASFKEGVYMHNGDPLGKPTTHVPKGINFGKDQFVDAAVHALNRFKSTSKGLGLSYDSKDVGAMATFAEHYNGLGYRNKDRVSPYVFAGTDQYKGGMYVADGVYSAKTFDQRPGVVAIINAYAQRYGHY
jgi:lysozyme family protein